MIGLDKPTTAEKYHTAEQKPALTSEIDIEHQIPTSTVDPPSKDAPSVIKGLSVLDRFLALWILLAMILGMVLGNFVPSAAQAFQRGSFAGVSIPIAVGLLVMMYPILCKIQFEMLHRTLMRKEVWIQIAFSLMVNWIIAPFFMLALAWIFLSTRQGLREGVILVGLARCIAMVLIWTNLALGDQEYCAILVAVNSVLQIILFSPLALLFLRVISHDSKTTTSTVSYSLVARSVAIFLGIPLGAAFFTRMLIRQLLKKTHFYDRYFIPIISPLSLIGLLFTIIVLFTSQGHHVVHQITSVLWVSAPLIVYFLVMFSLTLFMCWKFGMRYDVSVTQAFTAASNNFELAIAVAVAVFGINSDQALAATVGPLVEVPVMVALVYGVRWMGKKVNWRSE